MASTKSNKKAVNESLVYVSTYYGGPVMKMSTAYINVSSTHPEVELERLKEFYGNDVKGYYSKTTTSQSTILQLIKEKLSDKDQLSNNLYAISTKEVCKIIRETTGGKGVKMGPIKNKKKASETDDKEDDESEESEEEEEVKPSKQNKSKVKEVEETTSKKEVKESKTKETKPVKEVKEIKTKAVKEKKTKPVKEDNEVSLKNKTVIMLSDSEEDEEEA